MRKQSVEPCFDMDWVRTITPVEARVFEGIHIIAIVKSQDPEHDMCKCKTIQLIIMTMLLIRNLLLGWRRYPLKFDAVKVELWEESPDRLPSARQNACDNSLFGSEKWEDIAEERLRKIADSVVLDHCWLQFVFDFHDFHNSKRLSSSPLQPKVHLSSSSNLWRRSGHWPQDLKGDTNGFSAICLKDSKSACIFKDQRNIPSVKS